MPMSARDKNLDRNNPPVIAIVGGGAAGLMAAYFASIQTGHPRVVLLEKNSGLGAKIIISGGGRCNVTTGLTDPREVLKNYPRGSRFLRTAMYSFPPQSTMDWFESQGVPLKTETDQRVFPISNDGRQIVEALEKALLANNVQIRLNCAVKNIEALTSGFRLKLDSTAAKSNQGNKSGNTAAKDSTLTADRVILTTGGSAYRHTGSSGDCYAFAEKLGHHLTTLAPSLAALQTVEQWAHQLSGISFPDVELALQTSANRHRRRGPLLFTHRGISGPAVFALSALAAHDLITPQQPAHLQINFFPDSNPEKLSAELNRQIDRHPNKKAANLLGLFVPHSLAEKISTELLTPAFSDKNLTSLTAANFPKALRQKICATLTALPLEIIGRGAGEEFVTAGGVDLKEVNPATMESRLRRGLYFAGELLDIDGFTGGFNLQASWATGALAGESAARSAANSC